MKRFLISLWVLFVSTVTSGQAITLTPDRVDSLITVIGSVSPAKSFVVSGVNLTGNIVIPGSADEWEFSLSDNPFISTGTISLAPVNGLVTPTTVYVRLRGFYFYPSISTIDFIPIVSTGATTKNITVTGVTKALEPTVQSTLSFGTVTSSSIEVVVNGGNGNNKLILAKESSPVDAQPEDLYSYIPGIFGTGSQLGNGNFVVKDNNFPLGPVTGLLPGKTYYFAVFDYNKGNIPPVFIDLPGTENYLLSAGTGSATTSFGSPLPITINYFKGVKQTNKNLLTWKVTCISTPRATMILERSADSRNFTGINSITADALRCDQPFDNTDTDPLKGMNYYRLKMIDADGKVTYSSLVALLNAAKGFDITGIAPNPVVSDHFNLNIASAQAGKIEVGIVDMQGRLVKKESISLIAGFTSLPVMVSGLANGTYTLRCTMDGGEAKLLRFVKTGK